MIQRTIRVGLTAALCVGAYSSFGADGGPSGHGARHGATDNHRGTCQATVSEQISALPQDELSEAEVADLLFLREEEKLARDVYRTLSTVHDLPVFANIAPAEQHHMDLIGVLVERYGLEDPVADDAAGSFTDPRLRALYTDLVTRGRTSLEDALRVGATIEDMDLADLARLEAAADNADVRLVTSNLARGSRNHLRAFTRVLDRNGFEPYAPVHLDAAAFEAILASEHERGPGAHASGADRGGRAGRGGGPGHGQCRAGADS
jgi:hypothetical protein